MSNASHGRTYAGFNERYSGKPSKPGNKQDAYAEPPVSSPGPVKPRLFLQDPDVTLYHGDALEVLQGLPAESVHMCVTSPPFYGLRDYGTGRWEGGNPDCDHSVRGQVQQTKAGTDPNAVGMRPGVDASRCRKCGARRVDQQIGLEETPEQWVASLVAVFREVRRVLRPEGVLFVEVGDSYASVGSGYREGEFLNPGGKPPVKQGPARNRDGAPMPPNCKPKDLVGAPWMLAFALRADGWWLRSDIVWARPNPMPESVTDRPTKAHSYIFLLAKRPRYYWDAEALREPHESTRWGGRHQNGPVDHFKGGTRIVEREGRDHYPEGGRNVRSVWNIATQPYPEAHFATFPEELARRCILAGSSEWGCCPECGAPWIRQVEATGATNERERVIERDFISGKGGNASGIQSLSGATYQRQRAASGDWRLACVHDGHAPCVVLDPFVGSGTVPYVARKHGRHAIGIDLSQSYLELAARRLQQLSLFAQMPEEPTPAPEPSLRPQAVRAAELFTKAGLTEAHYQAIRAVGFNDAGKAQVTQSGYGKNDPDVQRLADEAKAALGGYYREFLGRAGVALKRSLA